MAEKQSCKCRGSNQCADAQDVATARNVRDNAQSRLVFTRKQIKIGRSTRDITTRANGAIVLSGLNALKARKIREL